MLINPKKRRYLREVGMKCKNCGHKKAFVTAVDIRGLKEMRCENCKVLGKVVIREIRELK